MEPVSIPRRQFHSKELLEPHSPARPDGSTVFLSLLLNDEKRDRSRPKTFRVEESSVLKSVRAFLPRMERAQEDLRHRMMAMSPPPRDAATAPSSSDAPDGSTSTTSPAISPTSPASGNREWEIVELITQQQEAGGADTDGDASDADENPHIRMDLAVVPIPSYESSPDEEEGEEGEGRGGEDVREERSALFPLKMPPVSKSEGGRGRSRGRGRGRRGGKGKPSISIIDMGERSDKR